MNVIRRMALSRRTFLQGIGAGVALPLLESMVPALSAQSSKRRVGRLGFVYIPMGFSPAQWTPREEGRMTELSPTLDSLSPLLDHVTVLTNLELKNAYSPGNHATSNSTFLSGVQAKMTEGSDYRLGTTVDQVAARQIGAETPLPSLELATDFNYVVGTCDNGFNCVYMNTLSWTSPTMPLPTEANPRVVFERLFGKGGTSEQRSTELRRNGSILDWVTEDMARLKRRVGPGDRTRLDQYLDTVREVERRIERSEVQDSGALPEVLERPVGVPDSWEEHAKLMFDLQVLALQADLTRVTTFQLAREVSTRTYPRIGVPDPHHPLTHSAESPEKWAKIAKLNAYHMSLFAYFLEKLSATPDGEVSLLDNCLYLCGSGMGNPAIHDHSNLPLVVAGGGAGRHRGGRHIRYENPTPMANLLLTLLDGVGVHLDSFADSTGRIDGMLTPASA